MHVNLIYVIASVLFVNWETWYYGNNWDAQTFDEEVADGIAIVLVVLAFICV